MIIGHCRWSAPAGLGPAGLGLIGLALVDQPSLGHRDDMAIDRKLTPLSQKGSRPVEPHQAFGVGDGAVEAPLEDLIKRDPVHLNHFISPMPEIDLTQAARQE